MTFLCFDSEIGIYSLGIIIFLSIRYSDSHLDDPVVTIAAISCHVSTISLSYSKNIIVNCYGHGM